MNLTTCASASRLPVTRLPGDKKTLTVEEVAALLGFSRQTITRLFEREPGVLVLKRPEKPHKRQYRSIRVPLAVYERVRRRLAV